MPKKASKVEVAVAVVGAFVGVASLGLNVIQYGISKHAMSIQEFKEVPRVSAFRVGFTTDVLGKIARLKESGAKFSYIPNPGVLDLDRLLPLPRNASTVVEFQAIVNSGPGSIDSLQVSSDSGSQPLNISRLGPESTLLIPISIHLSRADSSRVMLARAVTYHYSLASRRVKDRIVFPSGNTPVVVFETGLGRLSI